MCPILNNRALVIFIQSNGTNWTLLDLGYVYVYIVEQISCFIRLVLNELCSSLVVSYFGSDYVV